jgi:AraC-like DNA-binding protein
MVRGAVTDITAAGGPLRSVIGMNAPILPDEVAKLALSHTGIISQRSAIWDGIVCDLIVKGPTGDHEVVVSPTIDTLFLTRSSDPHPLVKRLNRQPPRALIHPGSIVNFVAAGDSLTTQVPRGNSGMERLAVSILPSALRRLTQSDDFHDGEMRSAMVIERPLCHELLKALAEEVTAPDQRGQLYAETLVLAALLDLMKHSGALSRVAPVKGGLAPWQLRRVEAMINDRLGEDVSLAELASAANLSKAHFARAFHHSTGMPPHKYQLNARIEHAKRLLRRGDISLTEVGVACGFGAQSQFIRAFNRVIGVTPGVWRRLQKT